MNEINDFEDSEKSFKTNTYRSQLHEWERLNVFPSRVIIYFSIFFAVFVFGGAFLAHMNFYNSDPESSRYFLSSLVQCQAAIISIVVSLTLIAVQLTAQKYSSKTVDIFKKDPDLWILLLVYIISIAYEFLILKEIEGSTYITENLGHFVSFAYLLGIFTFLVLIPYILNTINLLRTDTLISRLIDSVSEKNFPESRDYLAYNPNDPLQPIFEVIQTSVKQYDISTLDFALNHLLTRMSVILQNDVTLRSSDTVSDYFCKNLNRAGLLAIDKGDTDIFSIIVQTLEKFGRITSTRINGSNTISAIIALEDLGLNASEKNNELITHWIVSSINILGRVGAERKIRNITSFAISALKEIDQVIINKSDVFPRSEEIRDKIIRDISNIGEEIVRNSNPDVICEDRYAICDPIGALSSMGQQRFINKKYDEIPEIILSIGDIGYFTAAKCNDESVFERSFREVFESLNRMWNLSTDYELSSPTSKTIKKLGEISEVSIERNLTNTTTEAISALYHIYEKVKNNQKLGSSFEQFVKTLFELLLFIRYKKIDNDLVKEYRSIIIGRLKKIKKEDSTTFTKVIAEYRSDLSDIDPIESERKIFENLLEEIEKDS
ncbi:MAG: DUF2254 family protein [Methanoregula sp.]|jgi:hypothetical protein